MKQKDKELLLKDLCARLSYGVICNTPKGDGHLNSINQTIFDVELGINVDAIHRDTFKLENCKPYLRPMSSMTEEEKRELQSFFPGSFGNQWFNIEEETIEIFECPSTMTLYLNDSKRVIDFFNSRHIDYRGLIEEGLALKAPEGMYNKNN